MDKRTTHSSGQFEPITAQANSSRNGTKIGRGTCAKIVLHILGCDMTRPSLTRGPYYSNCIPSSASRSVVTSWSFACTLTTIPVRLTTRWLVLEGPLP